MEIGVFFVPSFFACFYNKSYDSNILIRGIKSMKKLLGGFLGAILAMGVMITPAFATYDDVYKAMMPGITKAQHDYAQQIMSKIKPDPTKLKSGIFQAYLPQLNSNYRFSIQRGSTSRSVPLDNKLGGETLQLKMNSTDSVQISVCTSEYDVLNEQYFDYSAKDKTIKITNYDQILRHLKALNDEAAEEERQMKEALKHPVEVVEGLTDIANHWGRENISKGVQLGFIKGYTDHTFKPDNTITRAELTTALIGALKLTPSTHSTVFTDDNNWAEGFIQAAIENGIIKPEEYSNNQYFPDQNITREEMAIMTVRALKLDQTATNSIEVSKIQTNLTDLSQVNEKWRGYVVLANNLGVVKGYEDHTFQPNQTATRAEAVTMILNMLNASQK